MINTHGIRASGSPLTTIKIGGYPVELFLYSFVALNWRVFFAQTTAERQFMASARQGVPVSVPFFGTSTARLGGGAGWGVEIAASGVFAKIDLDTVYLRRDAAFGATFFGHKKIPSSFFNLRGLYLLSNLTISG
jgi:hypothetical protein